MVRLIVYVVLGLCCWLPVLAIAASQEVASPILVIKDHKFDPVELKIPAGKKIKLIIDNQDLGPEEFESFDLHREKVISGKSKVTVFIGPLKPGTYKYFGDFHPQTAKGTIVVQ